LGLLRYFASVPASVLVGVLAGLWARSGQATREGHREGQPAPDERRGAPLALWVAVPAASCATRAVFTAAQIALDDRFSVVAAVGLWAWTTLWAGALGIFALVDIERMLLPTPWLRAAGALVAIGLAWGCSASRDWKPFAWAGISCAATAAGYLTWYTLAPASIGLGDVRLACLVAFGAGAFCPAASMAAVSCAPLAAGLTGVAMSAKRQLRSRQRSAVPAQLCQARPPTRVAVPLGPFLAVAGLVAAVGNAF